MQRRLWIFMLAAIVLGCGGGKDKGVNRDKDKPKAASEKEK